MQWAATSVGMTKGHRRLIRISHTRFRRKGAKRQRGRRMKTKSLRPLRLCPSAVKSGCVSVFGESVKMLHQAWHVWHMGSGCLRPREGGKLTALAAHAAKVWSLTPTAHANCAPFSPQRSNSHCGGCAASSNTSRRSRLVLTRPRASCLTDLIFCDSIHKSPRECFKTSLAAASSR